MLDVEDWRKNGVQKRTEEGNRGQNDGVGEEGRFAVHQYVNPATAPGEVPFRARVLHNAEMK